MKILLEKSKQDFQLLNRKTLVLGLCWPFFTHLKHPTVLILPCCLSGDSLLGFWLPLIYRSWLKKLPAEGVQLSLMHRRELLQQDAGMQLVSISHQGSSVLLSRQLCQPSPRARVHLAGGNSLALLAFGENWQRRLQMEMT